LLAPSGLLVAFILYLLFYYFYLYFFSSTCANKHTTMDVIFKQVLTMYMYLLHLTDPEAIESAKGRQLRL
jgi:hypothetical protein